MAQVNWLVKSLIHATRRQRCRSMSTHTGQQGRPLEGIRVLDLSTAIAGPTSAMYLGDLGAEVIKVEVPQRGDDTRGYGPPLAFKNGKRPEYAKHLTKEGSYFFGMNRNKKSITLNLKSEQGVKMAKELLKTCDILVENHITGRLNKMGLGYEDAKQVKPDIIYASITGYGQDGPYKTMPGYDAVISSEAGLVFSTGEKDGLPVKPGSPVTDFTTGLAAAKSILAALFARSRTGKGAHIDISMFDVQVSTLGLLSSAWLNAGKEAERVGTGHTAVAPWGLCKCSNGFLFIGIANDGQFQRLAKECGREDWLDREEFKTNNARVLNKDKLMEEIWETFSARTMEDWLEVFKGKFPVGRVNNMEKVFSHPQAVHRGLAEEIPHPYIGSIKAVGYAPVFDGQKLSAYLHPPVLGEHNEEILGGIGYDKKQLKDMLEQGII